MLSLAFDTATPQGRFALAEDGRVLRYAPLNVSGSFADALLPAIDEVLAVAGRRATEIDALGVTRGPGSFTGVRIGVATARAMAWALDTDLYAVSTLEAMGAALLRDCPAAEVAIPALDARRGEVFAAVLRRRGGWIEHVVAEAARTPDDWWRIVNQTLDDPAAAVWGGDGAGLVLGQGRELRDELRASGEPMLRHWSAAHPATAPALAVAMADRASGLEAIDPFALTPEYLRVSDAEVKRGLDLTPPPVTPGSARPEDRKGRWR